jgi:FkbM family methyltransferase
MPAPAASTAPKSFRLPNGLTVYGLSANDTLMVYRDIFEDDCYRRHGVTIRDGDCVLDVGANTGLFILYLNQVCARARVYAFEPVPAIFAVLERNVAAHSRLAVRLFNAGLSRQARQATFTYYPRLSNASTLYPDDSARAARRGQGYVLSRFHHLPRPLAFFLSLWPAPLRDALAERVRRYYLKGQAVTCALWTLSEFLRRHALTRVDLLKIDAEQSEQDILAGLAEEDWPVIRQVVVEVHGGEEATGDLVGLLRRRGFRTGVEPNPTFPSLSLVYGTRPGGPGGDGQPR